MSPRSLPPRPNLDQLKLQARELQRAHRDGESSAQARVAAHYPAAPATLTLADAQFVIAREYGFKNWAKLKQRVAVSDAVAQYTKHPRFDEALAALDAGDAEKLRALLASDPSLAHARTNLDPQYGYFAGATLLHHVAGNPWRDNRLPNNILDIARVLLEGGADVHARTLGINGGDTMGLLVTGKQASDMGVTGPMMDLLLRYGARLDVTSDDALDASLANHSPRAAEKMIELGAKADVLAAAGLGRMDLLRDFFDQDGHLRSRPCRNRIEMSERDAIGLALLYAYVREQREAVDFLLEKDGNWNITGVNNGAVLHRAAIVGDLDIVQRLVAKGADVSNRDNPFMTTPLGWANHGSQTVVFEWLRAHCPIDIHDAVQYGFREHVEARLREDQTSVNAQRDHAEIPRCAPLHCAAFTNRADFAALLLERGADPNLLAGNGWTPLDLADLEGATSVVAVLEAHGGKRTREAAKPSPHPDLKTSESLAAYTVDLAESRIALGHGLEAEDWDEIITVIADKKIAKLDASGQMSDEVMERIVVFDHITHLNLSNSKQLTDRGLRKLPRLPHLQHLEVSNAGVTDQGLEVLRELPSLTSFAVHWDRNLSDAGFANLTFCDRLVDVNLIGSNSGDGTINALTGKQHLRRLTTGMLVTDAALPLFHRFPMFTSWSGKAPEYSVMSFQDDHTNLMLDGPFTNEGLKQLAGLEGVSGLGFFWHATAITPDGLASLVDLPNLGLLGCGGALCTDVAMRHIASMPKLRMLQAQGTVATDAGFEALSRSQTIQYLWGRECPNLTGRGFVALGKMPGLKGLAVSCKNVDDDALRTLPRFPALRQLMPMDVQDDGFRHVGQCVNLERLWCMYCRDTTDAATAHLEGLQKLKTYYAGQTKITDRSLQILGRMTSLEKLEFWNCAGITTAGAAHLAGLPALREVTFDGCRHVTTEAAAAFGPDVRVRITP